MWRAWIESPGGELPFGLELRSVDGGWRGWLWNGEERIGLPRVEVRGGELEIGIDHYDSTLHARVSEDGRGVDGEWLRRRGPTRWSRMGFHGRFHDENDRPPRFLPRPGGAAGNFGGRWSVRFSESEDTAVGVFEQSADDRVLGTFLTTLGDYRYLAGRSDGAGLRLSCFDGAHAFLFHGRLTDGAAIEGDFWSSDRWHETWTGKRDAAAALADAFAQTRWTGVDLGNLAFPDLEGNERRLDDPAFRGKARIVQVFGTWCPNCNDEAAYLAELDRRYRGEGLSILGLAFEVSGEFQRDARMVERFAARHSLRYPILVAGVSDKSAASAALPILDRVRSYPTTLFLDSSGAVRAVHSGFAGPATGAEHERLRDNFERLIEQLLGETAGEGARDSD